MKSRQQSQDLPPDTIVPMGRRDFLALGLGVPAAAAIGVQISPFGDMLVSVASAETPPKDATFAPDAFIRITRTGQIRLVVARVEMGQGTYTALPVLVAEELEVDPTTLVLEHAPANEQLYANPSSGFQNTGGSTSIRTSWEPMRRAGATARQMLIAAAAQAWGVAENTCRAELGHVVHTSTGRRLAYGTLVDTAARLPVPASVPLKSPTDFRLIGQVKHRLDGREKVNGQAQFGIDARVPGMLVAAISLCPVVGGTLGDVDESGALKTNGVRKVLRIQNGVAVVADHYGAARKGLAALKIRWNEGANANYSTDQMIEDLADASLRPGAVARQQGDIEVAKRQAARTFDAVYQQPFLAHACMEPVNCTVHVRADSCELWLGTQVPTRAQTVAAAVTGLAPDKIQVHNQLLGGGFGRRLDVDFVEVAVRFARQLDRPLKVVWSREEDIRHSTFRPYHFNRLSACLDSRGRPSAWSHRVTGSSILARWAPQRFQNGVDGDAIRDAAGPYDFPNVRIDYVRREPAAGITTGFLRGVGHLQNAFPVECFLDELAQAAKADPIAYRNDLLARHPRAREVLARVARASGWGRPLPKGHGRGVALTYSFGSYAAMVTTLRVDAGGNISIDRIDISADCGQLVTPDTVVAQLQGGTVFGLSAVLYGNISIRNGRVEQGNFDSYRILRYNEMPPIAVDLVRTQHEPGGVGELSTVVVAPSLLNAVYAATGRRIRKLPFGAEELRTA